LLNDWQGDWLDELHTEDRARINDDFPALGQEQTRQQSSSERSRAGATGAAREDYHTCSGAADRSTALNVSRRCVAAMPGLHLAFAIGIQLLVFVPVINGRHDYRYRFFAPRENDSLEGYRDASLFLTAFRRSHLSNPTHEFASAWQNKLTVDVYRFVQNGSYRIAYLAQL
jgi:hypothetical protein